MRNSSNEARAAEFTLSFLTTFIKHKTEHSQSLRIGEFLLR